MVANLAKTVRLGTEMLIRRDFLANHSFQSERVADYVSTEFGFLSEKDLKKHTKRLQKLASSFTEAEAVEYLMTMSKWYEFKYATIPYEIRLGRAKVLSEMSLRTPIHMLYPIRYIELMALVKTIPAFKYVRQEFIIEAYIHEFVTGSIYEVAGISTRRKKRKKQSS